MRSVGASGNKLRNQLASLGNKAAGAKGKQAATLLLRRMANKAGFEVRSGAKHLNVVNPETGLSVTRIPHSPHSKQTILGIAKSILEAKGFSP